MPVPSGRSGPWLPDWEPPRPAWLTWLTCGVRLSLVAVRGGLPRVRAQARPHAAGAQGATQARGARGRPAGAVPLQSRARHRPRVEFRHVVHRFFQVVHARSRQGAPRSRRGDRGPRAPRRQRRALKPPYPEGAEVADFAMGCFWGAEKKFWQVPGVFVHRGGLAGRRHAQPDLRGGLLRPDRPCRGRPGRVRPARSCPTSSC